MGIKADHTTNKTTCDEAYLSNISYLTNACDCVDNLHISIYLLSKQRFIYNNEALSKISGLHSEKLLEQGWSYWYSLITDKERTYVKDRIEELCSKPKRQNPYILKYHIINENGVTMFLRHEIIFHGLGNQVLAINYFFDITEKEKFEAYLQTVDNSSVHLADEKAASISPRETEVLKLVADGFSSKQIADRLFISNHTAVSHRKNLIEKFNVKNTAQLIKRASRMVELW